MKLLTSIWLLWLLRQQHPRLRSGPRYSVTLGEHHRGDKARNPSRRPSYPMLNGYAAYLKYLPPIFRCSSEKLKPPFQRGSFNRCRGRSCKRCPTFRGCTSSTYSCISCFLRVNILLALKARVCLKGPAFLDLSLALVHLHMSV